MKNLILFQNLEVFQKVNIYFYIIVNITEVEFW